MHFEKNFENQIMYGSLFFIVYIYQGFEAILHTTIQVVLSCKFKQFLHRFCRCFSHPLPLLDICQDKRVVFIILSDKLLEDKLGGLF